MLLSFGLAGGIVYLKETTDRSVTARMILKLPRRDAAGNRPYIATPDEQDVTLQAGRQLAPSSITVVLSGYCFFHFLVKPLDVIWFML